MSPVLKPPLDDVTVWATWSLLVTVTVAPGATVRVLGAKAKFLMVMAWAPVVVEEPDAVVGVVGAAVVGVLLPELEHAARSRAPPSSVADSSTRVRRRRDERVDGWSVVSGRVAWVITLRSVPTPLWMHRSGPDGWPEAHPPWSDGGSRCSVDGSSGIVTCSEYSFVMVDVAQASDANLVVAVGRWNEQALAEVYRRHGGAVHALSRRILRSDPPAEEITQEVFLDLWNHPEKFDAQRGTLRSFLLARTHGKSVDYVRSEVSRRSREEKTSRETATAGYDIDREVWDLAVAEQVQEALGALPEELRKPIELAYFGGHTYREVAEMLQEPEGTVKSRIRSGLGRLRVNLAERGVQPAGAEL